MTIQEAHTEICDLLRECGVDTDDPAVAEVIEQRLDEIRPQLASLAVEQQALEQEAREELEIASGELQRLRADIEEHLGRDLDA